jgi:hypothetical protein
VASITITFTDNGDGSATVTSAFAPAQTVTSDALTKLIDVARGWVGQSMTLTAMT